ncbi:MAG: hypothetical protein R3268_05460, partial [Acidiferrobacterales bacterium]|nr:hypothetical protein [Acidiferrobacterales bacterium]
PHKKSEKPSAQLPHDYFVFRKIVICLTGDLSAQLPRDSFIFKQISTYLTHNDISSIRLVTELSVGHAWRTGGLA